MHKEDFFIGYSGLVPRKSAKKVKFFVYAALIVGLGISYVFVSQQNPFSDGQFTLGKVVNIEGYLHSDPFPNLLIKDSLMSMKMDAAMLVGPLKTGALPLLNFWKEKGMWTKEGKLVEIKGTIARSGSHTVIELTNGKESFLGEQNGQVMFPDIEFEEGGVTLVGEIADPKCLLGVMKPGYGKLHRSCAANCIAGGMPALFCTDSKNSDKTETDTHIHGSEDRYFIDWYKMKAETIPPNWLRHVGERVEIRGDIYTWLNWSIFYPDGDSDIKRLYSEAQLNDLLKCNEK